MLSHLFVKLNAVLLSVIILNVLLLSVVMLNVVMPSVVSWHHSVKSNVKSFIEYASQDLK
jgi:hypothetical protein